MKIILISGVSGSGKSVAINVLEDNNFYCVDNLPISLITSLVDTASLEGVLNMAIAIDVRNSAALTDLPSIIQTLKAQGHDVRCLFLNADSPTLIVRYSETRRKHPLSQLTFNDGEGFITALTEAIEKERELLEPIADFAHVIDTSHLPAKTLRKWVLQFVEYSPVDQLVLLFESFGYKYGVPIDADFVFDARLLPNPFYDKTLRPLTGLDQPVKDFLLSHPETEDYLHDIVNFLQKWLPSLQSDQRSYVTVAIGCTGGQHRSVFLVHHLQQIFTTSHSTLVRHRQVELGQLTK